MQRWRWIIGAVIVSVMIGLPVFAQPGADPAFADVPYGDDAQQALDIYLPESGEGPFPTLLAFHGGGFDSGSKAYYSFIAGQFTAQGYAFVAADYRLRPAFAPPAQAQDAFCALAWLHAHAAEYGFDAGRIVALGDSAGGYLAALLGTVDAPEDYLAGCPSPLPEGGLLRGVVAFYGAFGDTSPADPLVPGDQVDGGEPPFLLFHGAGDEVVPVAESEQFAALLQDAGVEVELVIYRGRVGHGYLDRPGSAASRQSLETMARALTRWFGGPRAFVDLPYIPDGTPSHLLDLALPPEGLPAPYPLALLVHGSGFDKGDFPQQTARLLDYGYAVVAVEYREVVESVSRLGPVEDAFCALAWVYANAGTYSLDTARIVVFGHSLGGWPAAMLGVADDPAQFLAGCPNPLPEAGGPYVAGVVTYAPAVSLPDAGSPASPYFWLDEGDAPFLLLHGDRDTRINHRASEDFAAALTGAGIAATLVILPEAGHGVRVYTGASAEADAAMDAFLTAIIGLPEEQTP